MCNKVTFFTDSPCEQKWCIAGKVQFDQIVCVVLARQYMIIMGQLWDLPKYQVLKNFYGQWKILHETNKKVLSDNSAICFHVKELVQDTVHSASSRSLF